MPRPSPDLAYRQLPDFFFEDVKASEVQSPKLAAINAALLQDLGLAQDGEKTWAQSTDGQAVLSGQNAIGGGAALAMAYGGHQFGHWSGLLGDGRARLVGDVTARSGLRYELHLKGAGRTPYSRGGDGKATLGSALREYIVSEAMAALSVPTTRALSVLTTGETIMRNSGPEPAAILCRAARSHVRVGTFQIAAASGDSDPDKALPVKAPLVKALADFAIERLYKDAPAAGPKRYDYFLRQVIAAQADLIPQWMGFGFIHGVMNTDNACVSGETIDYGPCAFMDDFHPAKTFSSIDRRGRYAWNKQPEIAHWNLARLAESLLPLLGGDEDTQLACAQAAMETFSPRFRSAFNRILADKFGVPETRIEGSDFIAKTFEIMAAEQVDFTLFFRRLTEVASGGDAAPLTALFDNPKRGEEWLMRWREASNFDGKLAADIAAKMRAANPVYIARNHQVEAAIAAANSGDLRLFHDLNAALKTPFEARAEFAHFEAPPLPDEIVTQTFCGT